MTPSETLTVADILRAFAAAEGGPPREAAKQAVERWTEVGPALISLLQEVTQAGGSEQSGMVLSIGIYLMAQMGEPLAYRPICALAADSELLERVLGDGITEDLAIILARVYDGDAAPLRSLIEAADADEFARNAAIQALTWLTATGRIDREEIADYLRQLHATLQPRSDSFVWFGWQRAIARLGLEDFVPLVEEAFRKQWVSDDWLSLSDFHDDLVAARQAADPTTLFQGEEKDDGRFDDVTALMSARQWSDPAVQSKPALPPPRALSSTAGWSQQPSRNPYRDFGRNDPCPCGSGKKFKKCCLNVVVAPSSDALARLITGPQ